MEIARIGERELIRRLEAIVSEILPAHERVRVGIGDDAAVVGVADGFQILTTDHLVEDAHFRREWSAPRDLGWKALAINLSDIAAMGGTPGVALVSLALPSSTHMAWLEELYRGLGEAARAWGVAIVGGDVSSAAQIVISIVLVGAASVDSAGEPVVLQRSAAHPGEAVAVTGTLGAAAAALRLEQGCQVDDQGDAAILLGAHQRPTPRIDVGQTLIAEGVRAAMDISDGLIIDLERICEASGVAAEVQAKQIPINRAVVRHFPDQALELAASGGEDYELLFTAPLAVVERVKARSSVPVTVVGQIVAGPSGKVALQDERGATVDLRRPGWQHFR